MTRVDGANPCPTRRRAKRHLHRKRRSASRAQRFLGLAACTSITLLSGGLSDSVQGNTVVFNNQQVKQVWSDDLPSSRPLLRKRASADWSAQLTLRRHELDLLRLMGGGLLRNQPADVVSLEHELSTLLQTTPAQSEQAKDGEQAVAAAKQYLSLTVPRQVSSHAAIVKQLTDAIAELEAAKAAPITSDQWLFNSTFVSYLRRREDTVAVAVYDANNGHTYLFNPRASFDTASIVKATILAALLYQSELQGHPLPASEKSLAIPMIEESNNTAASALWNDAGGSAGIQAFLRKAGMTHTTPGSGGAWGLTRTTALDQVDLMRLFAYPNHLLGTSERTYGLYLMEHVVSWEDWGVSTGPASAGATVALKNGWLPYPQLWWVNSIGYVHGDGRNYVIAILSSGNASEQYGIQTDDRVSQMIWNSL